MRTVSILATFLFLILECSALRFNVPRKVRSTKLHEIPLELTGKLDASKTWDVKFIFNGEEKIVNVREDTSILESAEKIFDGVQSSCRNGVCTTCAGQVSDQSRLHKHINEP